MAGKQPTLGQALSRFRQDAGLSLRQLEEASGVHRSVISRIERGVYPQPGPSILSRLGEALGVDARQLVLVAATTS